MKRLFIVLTFVSLCATSFGASPRRHGMHQPHPITVSEAPKAVEKTDAEKGEDHLRKICAQGKASLNSRGVASRAFPDQSVVKAIPDDLPRTIIAAEHIWLPKTNRGETPESVVTSVLSKIGRKGSRAFTGEKSKADATGLAQITPSSYHLLRRRYHEAGLNPSFGGGMTDGANVVETIYLHCDAALSILTERQRAALLRSPDLMRQYLIAAYNAGPGKARAALESGSLTRMDNGSLPKETVTHIKKGELYLAVVG